MIRISSHSENCVRSELYPFPRRNIETVNRVASFSSTRPALALIVFSQWPTVAPKVFSVILRGPPWFKERCSWWPIAALHGLTESCPSMSRYRRKSTSPALHHQEIVGTPNTPQLHPRNPPPERPPVPQPLPLAVTFVTRRRCLNPPKHEPPQQREQHAQQEYRTVRRPQP